MSQSKKEVYKNFIRGPLWALAMRWSIHLIGLVSVAIYARILSPEDFGLIAMGMVALGLITGVTELGAQQLLIREKNVTDDDCNTAWTIKILQGLLVALVLISVSNLAQSYFSEDRVKEVIYALAIFSFISGFENIGMVLARKDLDFAKDFRFEVYKRIFKFIVTLIFVLLLRNYWALIYGQISTAVFGVLISFIMHHYRPKISLQKLRKYLKFSAAIIPIRIGKYLNSSIDTIVVGGVFSTQSMGLYNIASQISGMFTSQLEVPLARGLMPNYSKLVGDPVLLSEAYVNVVRVVAIVTCAAGFGLAATAQEFITLLLGEKWLATVPIVKWLSLFGIIASLLHLFNGQIMIVLGFEKKSAILVWIRVLVVLLSVVVASKFLDLEGIAAVTFLSTAALLPLFTWSISNALNIRIVEIVAAIFRPFLAGFIMFIVLNKLFSSELPMNTFYLFCLELVTGAFVYLFSLLFLWALSGKPDGVEKFATRFVLKISR